LDDNIQGVWIIVCRKWWMEAAGRAQREHRRSDADQVLKGMVVIGKKDWVTHCRFDTNEEGLGNPIWV
jgi:hypothetical protein